MPFVQTLDRKLRQERDTHTILVREASRLRTEVETHHQRVMRAQEVRTLACTRRRCLSLFHTSHCISRSSDSGRSLCGYRRRRICAGWRQRTQLARRRLPGRAHAAPGRVGYLQLGQRGAGAGAAAARGALCGVVSAGCALARREGAGCVAAAVREPFWCAHTTCRACPTRSADTRVCYPSASARSHFRRRCYGRRPIRSPVCGHRAAAAAQRHCEPVGAAQSGAAAALPGGIRARAAARRARRSAGASHAFLHAVRASS
jgi:hypothetical protein